MSATFCRPGPRKDDMPLERNTPRCFFRSGDDNRGRTAQSDAAKSRPDRDRYRRIWRRRRPDHGRRYFRRDRRRDRGRRHRRRKKSSRSSRAKTAIVTFLARPRSTISNAFSISNSRMKITRPSPACHHRSRIRPERRRKTKASRARNRDIKSRRKSHLLRLAACGKARDGDA